MTDSQVRPDDDSVQATDDQRRVPRYFARAKATVVREIDRLRNGVPAKVYDLSIVGLGLEMIDQPPDLQEMVKVCVENTIQRVKRDVRGVVRHVTQLDNGKWRVGIELLTRLTPLEVSLLKMTGLTDSGEQKIWV